MTCEPKVVAERGPFRRVIVKCGKCLRFSQFVITNQEVMNCEYCGDAIPITPIVWPTDNLITRHDDA
jgi:ribosomal protein S27E